MCYNKVEAYKKGGAMEKKFPFFWGRRRVYIAVHRHRANIYMLEGGVEKDEKKKAKKGTIISGYYVRESSIRLKNTVVRGFFFF